MRDLDMKRRKWSARATCHASRRERRHRGERLNRLILAAIIALIGLAMAIHGRQRKFDLPDRRQTVQPQRR